MSDYQSGYREFRSSLHLIVYIVFALSISVGGVLIIGLIFEAGFFDPASLLMSGLYVFFVLLFVNLFLFCSIIVIDPEGIGYMRFNKIWKKITWDDVALIRIFTMQDPNGYPHRIKNINAYQISKKAEETWAFRHKLWIFSYLGDGPIVFNEKYHKNTRVLLDLINHYAAAHNIKILDCRKDSSGQQIERL
jgi:hypothetical protein